MILSITKDKDSSGNNRFFVESGEYFMVMSHSNVFSIYKLGDLTISTLNINKLISTHYSVTDAFSEFEKLIEDNK